MPRRGLARRGPPERRSEVVGSSQGRKGIRQMVANSNGVREVFTGCSRIVTEDLEAGAARCRDAIAADRYMSQYAGCGSGRSHSFWIRVEQVVPQTPRWQLQIDYSCDPPHTENNGERNEMASHGGRAPPRIHQPYSRPFRRRRDNARG
jgi:hypothetical protein